MKLLILISSITVIFSSMSIFAQSKMDLQDLDVKGELLGDNRIQMIKRQQNLLKNHVKFRTNFRKEIMEELEKPYPRYSYK
ncbi:MAG: hypothetical protein HOO06_05410 [Bdellovibrionaceae bacterium]|mgnify:CR=1 FL=1|nr:hypothetical protein [Pseudobdellovibrionaceae bacterium]